MHIPNRYTYHPKAHEVPAEDIIELMGEAYYWRIQAARLMARIANPTFDVLPYREQLKLRTLLLNAQTQLRLHEGTSLPTARAKPKHTKGDHHHSITWTV